MVAVAVRVAFEDDRDAGAAQQGGIVLARVEAIEAVGNVADAADDHRNAGGGELWRALPGFRRAHEDDAHVEVCRDAQHRIDFGDAVGHHEQRHRAVHDRLKRFVVGRLREQRNDAALGECGTKAGPAARFGEERPQLADELAARRRAGRTRTLHAHDNARWRFAQQRRTAPDAEIHERMLP